MAEKCDNPHCKCTSGLTGEFCSEYCGESGRLSTTGDRCECGHAECSGAQ